MSLFLSNYRPYNTKIFNSVIPKCVSKPRTLIVCYATIHSSKIQSEENSSVQKTISDPNLSMDHTQIRF